MVVLVISLLLSGSILVIPGCCDTDSTPVPVRGVVTALPLNYYWVEGLVSGGAGTFLPEMFGTRSFSIAPESAGLVLDPGASIRLDVPDAFRSPHTLLELQINYVAGGNASFHLEDDQGQLIRGDSLSADGTDAHQTHTMLVDLTPFSGTTFVQLTNTERELGLRINGFLALFKIEAANSSGIYIADLTNGSPRIDTDQLDFQNLVFDISGIISKMARPVAEFNFDRDEDAWGRLELYDESDTLVGYYEADGDCCENMGQTFVVDLTAFKNSRSFRLNLDDFDIQPFLKIQDAGRVDGTAVLLDVAPDGRDHSAASGKFSFFENAGEYPTGGMSDTTLSYGARHWLADPTSPPYGSEGMLEMHVPSEVASYGYAVLEIVHFAPDSDPGMGSGGIDLPDNPNDFPVDFVLLDENDTTIAHVRFETWSDDRGGILRNQIPLGPYKVSPVLKIRVPADTGSWGQAAFPSFLRVFEADMGVGIAAD